MFEHDVLAGVHFAGSVLWEEQSKERLKNPKCVERYGFKVFSQNEEDGIIEEIFRRIGTTDKRFIEFGVGNGLESNCHYLLFKDWSGLWIEGDKAKISQIGELFAPVIKNNQLKAVDAFITKDNINDLFAGNGFKGEIDLLSIDIDGNDYHIWKAVNVVNPRVVIIEYNAKFPPNMAWTMAYNEYHLWDGSDCQGASLKALELLGRELGYRLVGTNYNGVNAFFVRQDLTEDKFIEPATAENLYNPSRFIYRNYQNAHPSKYCLYKQEPHLGLLNYRPNCGAIPYQGFHSEDNINGHIGQYMSGTNADILVRNAGGVVIPYFIAPQILAKIGRLFVSVKFDEITLLQTELTSQGELQISLPQSPKPCMKLQIGISHIWSTGNGINNGIALFFRESRTFAI